MPISKVELETIIRKELPHSSFHLVDIVGDQNHYSLEIKDPSFVGKSLLQQHKIVKLALKSVLSGPLHAITIKIV